MMCARLCGAVALLVIFGAAVHAADPPKEIQDKVKAFEESVQKSPAFTDEIKKAVKAGAQFYGKPSFIGGNLSFGPQSGYFTFWLFNENEKPTRRAYSIDAIGASDRGLMKAAVFAFEHKAHWVAVYVKSGHPEQPLYITVYP